MSPRHLCAGALQALLLLAAAPAAAQDAVPGTWPRLFFSPEERRLVTLQRQAALDGGRSLAATATQEAGPQPTVAQRAPTRVDGISLVRGARFAAWIGGRRIEDGGRWDGYRLRVTRDGVEFIDATGSARLIKVGQPVWQPAWQPGRPTGRPAP